MQNTKLAWGYAERRSISMMGHQNTKKCSYFIVSQRVMFWTKKKPLLFSAKIPAILWGMSDKTKYNLRSSCRICVISVPLGHSQRIASTKFLYTPTGAWHGKIYGMAWQEIFLRHAKKTQQSLKNEYVPIKFYKISKNNSVFILLLQNKAISLQRNSNQQNNNG